MFDKEFHYDCNLYQHVTPLGKLLPHPLIHSLPFSFIRFATEKEVFECLLILWLSLTPFRPHVEFMSTPGVYSELMMTLLVKLLDLLFV